MRRVTVTALLTIAVIVSGSRPAVALDRCQYGVTGRCCCAPLQPSEVPAVQAPCCCLPQHSQMAPEAPDDAGVPPTPDAATAPRDSLALARPADAHGAALAETWPFDPPIPKYLLVVSIRR